MDVLTALTLIIIVCNYFASLLNVTTMGIKGGFMERVIQNVRVLMASLLNGVSAVCAGVVATGVGAGLSLESASSLGFYLSLLSLTPS
ncbi:hypothetical protein CGI72_22850 [Vibrio parahaemolyticus]|nr:hypothetical protein CGI73_23140 [Vibrio parahaemolyticus]TOH86858.1 hypothetical protein CGI72_22850 [Vibrio parahaemolyticus]